LLAARAARKQGVLSEHAQRLKKRVYLLGGRATDAFVKLESEAKMALEAEADNAMKNVEVKP